MKVGTWVQPAQEAEASSLSSARSPNRLLETIQTSLKRPPTMHVEENRSFNTTEPQIQYLVTVVLFIILLASAVTGLVVTFVVDPLYVDSYKERFYTLPDPQDLWEEFSADIIPPIRSHFRKGTFERSTPDNLQNPLSSDCIQRWASKLKDAANLTYTDPSAIRATLRSMHLEGVHEVEAALGTLLSMPEATSSFLEETEQCISSNDPVSQFACKAEEDPTLIYDFGQDRTQVLQGAIHFGIVLERLTSGALKDFALGNAIVEHLFRHQFLNTLDYIQEEFKSNALYRRFRMQKMKGMMSLTRTANAIQALGSPTVPKSVLHAWRTSVRMNIAEAAFVEMDLELDNNFWSALSLITKLYTSPRFENYHLPWPVGKTWADAYISWNMAYVTATSTNIAPMMSKLLIPSLSCTSDPANAENFIEARGYSLLMALFFVLNDEYPGKTKEESLENLHLASAWGVHNRVHSGLPDPTADEVEEALHDLCIGECHDWRWDATHTSPTYSLNKDQFRHYLTFVYVITVLISGFGSEIILGRYTTKHGTPEGLQEMWMYAQLLFALNSLVAIVGAAHQSIFGLPFLVIGLWKFGFPETFLHLQRARLGGWVKTLRALSSLFDGAGSVVHHSSSTFLVCLLCSGVVPPIRCVFAATFPLIMQHWIVLLKYQAFPLYVVTQLVLEIFWEWEIIASFEEFYQYDAWLRHGAAGMLLAHWFYIASVCFLVLDDIRLALKHDITNNDPRDPIQSPFGIALNSQVYQGGMESLTIGAERLKSDRRMKNPGWHLLHRSTSSLSQLDRDQHDDSSKAFNVSHVVF